MEPVFTLFRGTKGVQVATDHIEIDPIAKFDLHQLLDSPPLSPAFAAVGKANPNLFVIAVNFDGSSNDFTNLPPDCNATLIAQCHQELLNEHGLPKDTHVQSIYVRGVGTKGKFVEDIMGKSTLTPRAWENATGSSCAERVQVAYDEVKARIRIIHGAIPKAKFHIHVTGFSRGGASALHFMDMVHQTVVLR